ncbi:MAG: hypothetical protein HY773_01605 [Candidatus Terrybacteria bacterium]|nr:hypothetical protein [Candidatus Terrybacteria bacterium]
MEKLPILHDEKNSTSEKIKENEEQSMEDKKEDKKFDSIEKWEEKIQELKNKDIKIGEEITRLNEEGLKLGREKYGYDVVEWTGKTEQEINELIRQSNWNNRLLNELYSKSHIIELEPEREPSRAYSQELIEKLNFDSYENFVSGFKKELGEKISELSDEFERQSIDRNDKIKIDLKNFGPEEVYFSHIDAEQGLLYFSSPKIKESNVLSAIDVRDIEQIKKLKGNFWDKFRFSRNSQVDS